MKDVDEKISKLIDESDKVVELEAKSTAREIKEALDEVDPPEPQPSGKKSSEESLKRIKRFHTPPTRLEFENKLKEMDKQIKFVEGKTKSTADVLIEQYSMLKGLTQYMLSRLEATMDLLERSGVMDDSSLQESFDRVMEYQKALNRIMGLPTKERIDEVLEWNKEEDHKKIKMESVGVVEYLISNPDGMSLKERTSLAEKAKLSTEVIGLVEASELQKETQQEAEKEAKKE